MLASDLSVSFMGACGKITRLGRSRDRRRAGHRRRATRTHSFLVAALATALLTSAPAFAADPAPAFSPDELEPLLESLEQEGLRRDVLDEVFYDPRLRKARVAVSLNAVNPDSAELYRQFTESYAIWLSKRFKRRHFHLLERVERETGIPANIVTAILLVETQFGTYPLRYRPLEVYTTMVVDAREDALDSLYEQAKSRYPDLDREYFASRVADKAQWAYAELVALLTMGWPEPSSLYDIRGSYAGAFGMPQFLPTSYRRFATDGNSDGLIDLNNTADAVASIANFLREHGWRDETAFEDRMRAVWLYNRSPHYVNTIFEVSRRMSLPPRKTLPPRDTFTASAEPQEPG
jgi:membrane-bound lytic murein transglycosylase B